MEIISEDVTRSARFRGSNGEKEMLRHFLEIGVQSEKSICRGIFGVQMEKRKCCGIFWGSNGDGVEDCIRDEVLRIVFCSCVTLGFGGCQWRSL